MDSIKVVIKAADFAAKAHRTQMRKDGDTPYINHPIGVAANLTEIGGINDPNVIAAALLHDVVEDCDVTLAQIQAEFGPVIAKIVDEVTDDKTLPKLERKRLQIVHVAHASVEAKLVKMADKLYNLKDLLRCTPIGWDDRRVNEYFEWAKKVIDGLRGVNAPLEKALDDVLARGLTRSAHH